MFVGVLDDKRGLASITKTLKYIPVGLLGFFYVGTSNYALDNTCSNKGYSQEG